MSTATVLEEPNLDTNATVNDNGKGKEKEVAGCTPPGSPQECIQPPSSSQQENAKAASYWLNQYRGNKLGRFVNKKWYCNCPGNIPAVFRTIGFNYDNAGEKSTLCSLKSSPPNEKQG